MTTAKQTASSVGYLPETDESSAEANFAYQEALRKLNESLDARKNRFFDPMWLAAARGFAAPTKTGSFFESLGNVAGNLETAREQRIKEQQEEAQQRLGVASAGLELERRKQLGKMLLGQTPAGGLPAQGAAETPVQTAGVPGGLPATFGSGTPTAPSGAGALPSGAPKQSDELANILDPNRGLQMLPGREIPTADQIKKIGLLSGQDAPTILKNVADIEAKATESKEAYTLDRRTGKIYLNPTSETIEREINGNTYKVNKNLAILLDDLRLRGDPMYETLSKRISDATPSVELQERKKAIQKQEIESELSTRGDLSQREKDATETLTTANVLRKYANDPSAGKMFGILQNDKVTSGIATLIKDAVKIGNITIGIGEIENVMRNAGLNATDQAKYRTFLMYSANQRLQLSKYMKGAVSDFEQRLMADAVANERDTPTSLRMKSDILTLRAQLDRKIYRAFKASKMDADDFMRSDGYYDLIDKYNDNLASIVGGEKMIPPSGTRNRPGNVEDRARSFLR